MASNQKDVNIKVETEAKLQEVQALENKINEIKRQKLKLDIDANTEKLQETENRIQGLKTFLDNVNHSNTPIHIDDSQIKKAEQELDALESEKIDIELAIEKGKLDSVKTEVEDLDGTTIDVDVNNISAMEAVDQIGQGFDRLKQGASEVGAAMGEVLESAGRMEQTETFLSMNLGADQAKKKLQEIRSVTDQLPGDDVTLQNLLSQAALKDANMTTEAFTQMGSAAADYMAAMQNFGKTSTETQQDLMNYILAGNTAEIERSPILQAHVDKLKEGTTVQERAKLLQEALTAEGWNGIASQDIYNNKLQQFNDMIERGKMNLGGMFLEGSSGAMDFIMKLDQASGGIVGMGIALAGFASPIADTIIGLGQMAQGFNAIKSLGIIKWFKELSFVQKAYEAVTSALIPVQYAEGAAGWFSIGWLLVAVAAGIALGLAFIWLYNNCDWFRQGVDNLVASLQWLAGVIYNNIMAALQWLSDQFNQFTQQLGLNTDDWIQAVLGFILFLPTLPARVAVELANTIAKALGFGDNFVQTMIDGASNAVNGFISWISQLPGKLAGELNEMLQMAKDFVMQIANLLTGGAAGMVIGWITGSGESSPGYMYDAFQGELSEMAKLPGKYGGDITGGMRNVGANMVSSFDPDMRFANGSIASVVGGGDMVINVYGDVDNDRRVQQIVEAVRRELNWNNTTAGRRV